MREWRRCNDCGETIAVHAVINDATKGYRIYCNPQQRKGNSGQSPNLDLEDVSEVYAALGKKITEGARRLLKGKEQRLF